MAVHNGQSRAIPDLLNRSVSPQRTSGLQNNMYAAQEDDDDEDDVPLAVRKQILASSSQTPSSSK